MLQQNQICNIHSQPIIIKESRLCCNCIAGKFNNQKVQLFIQEYNQIMENKLSKEDGKIINIIQLLDFTSTYKQILRLYINCQQKSINQRQANTSKKVVLIGEIGSGKTTIFNKCCKQNQETYFGGSCCTKNPSLAKSAYGKGFIMIDTPGLGNYIDKMTNVCGISKALSEGDTHQILVCLKFERIDFMGKIIRDIIVQKLNRFRDTITVVITHFDLALKQVNKLKSIEEQNEFLQKSKEEISQTLKKYNVDSVLFTKEDESGQIICSQLDQILGKIKNGRKCVLQKIELMSQFELIDDSDDSRDLYLMSVLGQISVKFSKIVKATKKFINQFDSNHEFLVDIMHALSLAIKEKALEILEQYEKDYMRDFEELYEDQQEEVVYYIHAKLKAELFDQIQSVQFAAQQKISRFYQYADLIKQCPYCGLIWIKVDSCQGPTYCGEYSEKDNDQMFLQSQQSRRFQFNFSVEGVTLIENPQIIQMINKNKQKKPQDQLQLIGCGKKFNWQEIRPLDEDKMRELYDIGILDYFAVVNPKYSKSQQILSDKIDQALKGVQIKNL